LPNLKIPNSNNPNGKRIVINLEKDSLNSLKIKNFPNAAYFIKVAKTIWHYLIQYALFEPIANGLIKNSAVLIGFSMDRKGNITKVWVQDTTNAPILEELSVRAVKYVKDNFGSFGNQPSNTI